jgi:hypothetical protein
MALMSTQERALINQRRRESYHVKKLLRIEEMVEREKFRNRLPAQKEGKREYKCRMKECNNLHLDSIAMANSQFVPKLIFPTPIEPLTSESELVFPEFNGSPVYIPWIVEQTLDVQGTESGVGRSLPRRRVVAIERNALRNKEIWSSMQPLGKSRL